MAENLNGKKIAIIATDGVEQVELVKPREAVESAGGRTELLSLEKGKIQAMNGDIEPADKFAVDKPIAEAAATDYDGVILPGGTVNADRLRMDQDVLSFVRDVFKDGKPVGVICHGPWTLVEADLVDGRTLTSFPSLRTDIRNAGGHCRRRGGRGRPGPGVVAQPRRPARVLREDRRGVRRGRAPGRVRRRDSRLTASRLVSKRDTSRASRAGRARAPGGRWPRRPGPPRARGARSARPPRPS